MDKLDPIKDGASKDILEENIQKLKKIFPEVVTESKIDFEKLRETLGEYVEDREERYNFTWNGKSEARRLAQTPSTGTLRPCPDESVNWKKTENLFIEGDNLEVLKLLQKSYHKKVKMIYIDPPYNTGSQFIYPDDFRDNIKNYLELTGQTDQEGRKLSVNPETSGRYHTDWLNMMYPRLKLARNLLRDEGVIFISIDDNEVSNLRKMCDEVFGEENSISIITRVAKTTSFRGNYFAPSKDYILCYAKNISFTKPFMDEVHPEQFNKVETEDVRRGERYRDDIAFYLSTLETRPNQRYFIECPDGSKVVPPGTTFPPEPPKEGDGVWRWNLESFNEKKHLIVFKKSNQSPLIDEHGNKANWNLYTKSYLKDKQKNGNIPRDFWNEFLNRHGTSELKKLKIPYSFPKPTGLIKHLLKIIGSEDGDIIVDFFAGSSSTAHAVFDLNNKDKKNRKFIMVQLPEPCDEKSEAYKAGYKTIAEIGKERIRRVIKKIKKEEETKNRDNLFRSKEPKDDKQPDLGFNVFKLDSSNIKPWEAGFDNLDESLFDAVENIKPERGEADVLYELLLKYGLDLTVPIESRNIDHKPVHIIGAGVLIVCLADNISLDVVEGIAKLRDELKPELMRVVFKDAGFEDDVVKTNTVQILRQHGIEDVKSV